MMKTKLSVSALIVIGTMSLTPVLALADAAQAKATAVRHAEFAVNADAIAGVRMHLHHVLNCLVGPDGRGFDQSAGNPCGDSGAAIPQTDDPELKMELEELAARVREGLRKGDMDSARDAAKSVLETLAGHD